MVWGKLISSNSKHPHKDLEKDEIYIGRNSECTISFPNSKEISGKHCRIFKEKDVIMVEDLSSNGTFINAVKIGKGNKTTMRDGDELSLVVPSSFKALKSEQFAEKFIAYLFKDVSKQNDTENSLEKVYDIRQELGSGNFATVKLGVHRSNGETVAVKIIDKKKFAMNSSLKKDQIIEEARIMKAIRHPYILSIKDIFDDEENIYMILELATGGDLFDAVVTKGQYSEQEAKVLFGQLASAVGYLHDQGIAHRDLKPENILMTNDGGIKLSDFGLSKIIGEEQLMKTLCGTPKYLAPEIIFHSEGTAEGGYSKAVDCWSMGVILYILLAGYPPFGDDSFEDIKKGEFVFDDDPWDNISKNAKDLITKLLTVNPSKRYTVAQIFAHPWMKGISRTQGEKDVDKNVVLEVKKSVSRESSKEEIPKSPKKTKKTAESPKKSPKKAKKTEETKKRKPNKQDVDENSEKDSDAEEEEEEEEEDEPKKKKKKGKN